MQSVVRLSGRGHVGTNRSTVCFLATNLLHWPDKPSCSQDVTWKQLLSVCEQNFFFSFSIWCLIHASNGSVHSQLSADTPWKTGLAISCMYQEWECHYSFFFSAVPLLFGQLLNEVQWLDIIWKQHSIIWADFFQPPRLNNSDLQCLTLMERFIFLSQYKLEGEHVCWEGRRVKPPPVTSDEHPCLMLLLTPGRAAIKQPVLAFNITI